MPPATSPPASGSGAPSPSPAPSASAAPVVPSPATPAPSPSGDPVLVGAGDIASCGLTATRRPRQLIDGIAGTVFTAGDNAYETARAAQFRDCYDPTWGRFKDRTRPAAGNHDWLTQDAPGYRDYFGAAAVNDAGDTWYSYDLGAWHVIVLDSNCANVGGCGADSTQGTWLAADLVARPPRSARWRSGTSPGSAPATHGNDPSVGPFWDALHAAGADVVVNGHDHDYERFAPQDPERSRSTASAASASSSSGPAAPRCAVSRSRSRTASSGSRWGRASSSSRSTPSRTTGSGSRPRARSPIPAARRATDAARPAD